jgi:ABC-type multidrug transport system fused ATPase/permease subunit
MQGAEQIMKLSTRYFNSKRCSDFHVLVERTSSFAGGGIVFLLGTSTSALFTSFLLLSFVFLLSWKLALIAITMVAMISLLINRIHRRIVVIGRRMIDSTYACNRSLFDIINGIKLIHLFNNEDLMARKFEKTVDVFNDDEHKMDRTRGLLSPSFEALGFGLLALILLLGSLFSSQSGSSWLPLLLTFVVVLTRLINPAKLLNINLGTFFNMLPPLQELERFLDTSDKEYLRNGRIRFQGLQRSIEFRQVSFGYNPEEAIVFNDLSFVIPRGKKIGIVGSSGSGKSTIIELLFRFYDPQKGHILVDGTDLKELNLVSWRKHIGVVAQDTFLFHDTVRNNIAFASPGASQEQIELAAKRAYAHEFIKSLPKGYDTLIGERGVLLSGGERQRLAISRAILAEPEILVFDEATSSLDTESEKIVQAALDEISEGKTVIAIAHRLSTLANFDKIIVVDKGAIAEIGPHHELIQKGGLYKKFVQMQAMKVDYDTPEAVIQK